MLIDVFPEIELKEESYKALESPPTSHFSPLTSHLSPLTSHLSPLSIRLSPLTSQESYKGLKVQVERVPFNDEAYDMSLFKLRDQNANLYDAEPGQARVMARLAKAYSHTALHGPTRLARLARHARSLHAACARHAHWPFSTAQAAGTGHQTSLTY